MTQPTDAPGEAVLSARAIGKYFPGVRALDGASLTLRAGEVHALLGENGAGKSTLIKIITGVQPPDAGEVLLDGTPIAPRSVRDAEQLGIRTVYQEVNLVPMRSVAENLYVGRFPRRFGLIRWGEVNRRARVALAPFGLDIDVTRPAGSYSTAIQQMVAIARAVDEQDRGSATRVLILDEPTSSLDASEVEQLLGVMRQLKQRGIAIVFVTHFLEQVYAVADRITVLRNGKFIGEWLTKDLPRLSLVSAMIGRELEAAEAAAASETRRSDEPSAAPAIRVVSLGKRGKVEPVDFSIARGESVGLAGLLGSGRTETAKLVFGVDVADRGHVEIDGAAVRLRSPRQAVRHGIAMSPEDRKSSGIIPNLSVRENVVLALQGRRGIFRRLSSAQQLALADRFIAALGIKTPSTEQPIRLLSGGNQQKVLLARWLATEPTLLILDEPTRGIDVGAKAEIVKLIGSLCRGGMSVLFISSELEEVVSVCRRVVVLRDRRKIAELSGETLSEQQIMRTIAAGGAA
jgi:simple sugar transport system ATP-binding protein